MSLKRINWFRRLGLRTTTQIQYYFELRKAFNVRDTLDLMRIDGAL